VETGLPVIRAANTGISAIIDPLGGIEAGLDYGQKGIIDATLSSKAGDVLSSDARKTNFWLLFITMLIVALFSRYGLVSRKN
jgi:apolipoprotein N-acyltransferase